MPAFVPVYSAFAAAYLLSYLFRTVNAVISPELTRELGLAAASLGFLTSAYFLAFGLMQIPVGMLLDRYGPRRVEPVLLAFAASGALLFGLADGLPGLTLATGDHRRRRVGVPDGAAQGHRDVVSARAARVAVGLDDGCRRTGCAGGDDAARIRAALHRAGARSSSRSRPRHSPSRCGSRGAFPTRRGRSHATDVRAQFRGVRSVFSHPRFWWIAPLAGFGMGSFFAVQGLWAVPWMMEVEGLSRATAASLPARDEYRQPRRLPVPRVVRDAARPARASMRGICLRRASRSNAVAFALIALGLSRQRRCGGRSTVSARRRTCSLSPC